jgi:hypothetical protein
MQGGLHCGAPALRLIGQELEASEAGAPQGAIEQRVRT